jgi:hypothetical protein
MIHSIKRYAAFFVLLALAGAVPVFANTVNKKNETVVVDIQGKKSVPLISKAIGRKESHKYQISLQPGEKAVFRLRSDKGLSLKIQAANGVKEVSNERFVQGVLSVAGDYEIEVSTNNLSLYTLEISGN